MIKIKQTKLNEQNKINLRDQKYNLAQHLFSSPTKCRKRCSPFNQRKIMMVSTSRGPP